MQLPHDPHAQPPLQVLVCMPQFPHGWDCEAPGEHSPSSVQLPHDPHAQPPVQVLVCVPQFPHGWDCEAPGEHSPSPMQSPHIAAVVHT